MLLQTLLALIPAAAGLVVDSRYVTFLSYGV